MTENPGSTPGNSIAEKPAKNLNFNLHTYKMIS